MAGTTSHKRGCIPRIVTARPDDEIVLARHLENYYRELAGYTPWLCSPTQGFAYPNFASYWNHADRTILMLMLEAQCVGLAFVHNFSHFGTLMGVNDIEEFYIVRDYRRSGLGSVFASWVLCGSPGVWEIRVRSENTPAVPFWRQAISRTTSAEPERSSYIEDGSKWILFRFKCAAVRLDLE